MLSVCGSLGLEAHGQVVPAIEMMDRAVSINERSEYRLARFLAARCSLMMGHVVAAGAAYGPDHIQTGLALGNLANGESRLLSARPARA